MSAYLESLEGEVMAEIRKKSRNLLYQQDPEAWLWDVLGVRLWSKQAEIMHSFATNQFTLVKSCNGVGKDLRLSEPIPTPTGWTTMGALKPGDLVFDELGKPTRVLTKSEVFTNHDLYRVTFSDGVSIVASGTHEWTTLTLAERRGSAQDWRVEWYRGGTRTTAEIAATLRDGRRFNHLVPVNLSLDLRSVLLPVDPYVLGAWLGDGSTGAPHMTFGVGKEDVRRQIEEAGYRTRDLKAQDDRWPRYTFAHQGFGKAVRALGVYERKAIPASYLRAGTAQRFALLRGLMDTDGFASHGSVVGIDLTNEALAHGVAELVRTLGVRCSVVPAPAKIDGREVGTRWRLVFNPTFNPFSQGSPKFARWARVPAQASRATGRTIIDVRPVPTEPTQCISVDSASHLYLAGEAMIPTHNTQVAGFAVCWFGNVFETLGTSIMVSAPVRAQIDEMMFRYLRSAYQMSVERGRKLVGEIMPRKPSWIVDDVYKHDLVTAKRPADSNLLSSFQGTHNDHVAVVLDEAGGLAEDFYIGANAVTTNEHAAILAIGNPDKLNTAFHRRFTDRERFVDWHPITIGAEDTPNFTGEVIYPENPELDRKIKARLVQVEWAAMMRRSALPGVVAAKVDGEFPDADDSTFFDEATKTRAWETEIEPASTDHRWIGVDLSYSGEDQCVAYLNHGGRLRVIDSWNRYSGTEHMESAKRIHKLAKQYEATEVRVDAAGTGSGVYSNLKTEADFADRRYVLVGILGANASPNRNVWLNARAWHYDSFRRQMREGKLDIDMLDKDLREDMDVQSWFPTGRGQIQITSKTELKKAGLHSPDHLDAAIYASVDLREMTEGPAAGLEPGDELALDPWTLMEREMLEGIGMPI